MEEWEATVASEALVATVWEVTEDWEATVASEALAATVWAAIVEEATEATTAAWAESRQ